MDEANPFAALRVLTVRVGVSLPMGIESIAQGSVYGQFELDFADIHAACERIRDPGAALVREAGPMSFAVDETGHRETIAFIEDPDGYKIEADAVNSHLEHIR